VADGASESFQPETIDDSWRRRLLDFHVDPQSKSVSHLLTERELRISREPLHSFLLQAQEEIDRLYAIIRPQSYVVLSCNSERVANPSASWIDGRFSCIVPSIFLAVTPG